MADILIDNWTLERATVNINNTYYGFSKPDECHIKIAEAITLWDNVYFIDNGHAEFWKPILKQFGYLNFLKPIESSEFQEIDYSEFPLDSKIPDVIQKGALRYIAYCNKRHIAYLPSSERANYLKNLNLIGIFVDRDDVIDHIDKELLSYYKTLNERFGVNKIKLNFPILFDFISANTSDRYYLKTALELKKEKEVIQFRRWLTDFESALQQGRLLELEKLLSYVKGVIEDLTRVSASKINGELQIGLSPSISFPFSFSKRKRKLFHLDFLRTLIKYGVNGDLGSFHNNKKKK